MINDGRFLAIAYFLMFFLGLMSPGFDFQKVLNIRPREGIGAQSHGFHENQDAHLPP
jgi:hypothetical protein